MSVATARKAPAKKAAQPTKAEIKAKLEAGQKAKILERLASGDSLRHICSLKGMPAISTAMKWAATDDEFAEQYARAREAQADLMFEELDDVSESATKAKSAVQVNGLRLKADNIKWKLARMSPKKYGEKVQVGGAADLPPVQQAHALSEEALIAIAAMGAKGK